MEERTNYFTILNGVNVGDKVEKKNGLSYLSWAWAWGEVKKRFPDSTYTVYENRDGLCYHTDGKTCWVKTGVTVNGIEHVEYLPVMDHRNRSIPVDAVTSFDVNKAIQRSLTKAIARHGLGLYIYAGEDLPEDEAQAQSNEQKKPVILCEDCKKPITAHGRTSVDVIVTGTKKTYGRCLCYDCAQKQMKGDQNNA